MNAPQKPFVKECDGIRESCRLYLELSRKLAYFQADRLLSRLKTDCGHADISPQQRTGGTDCR